MQNFRQIHRSVWSVALTKVSEQTDGNPDKYAEPAGWHDHATDKQTQPTNTVILTREPKTGDIMTDIGEITREL